MLKKQLMLDGIDCSFLMESDSEPTGHAVIQVSEKDGNNAILLFGGANQHIERREVQHAIDFMSSDDILLMQNEINNPEVLISIASEKHMRIFWNPAPMTEHVKRCPLEKISLIALNEIECEQLVGTKVHISCYDTLQTAKNALIKLMPNTDFILTLGADGAVFISKDRTREMLIMPAFQTNAVDTTGAGDTFFGYFTAEIAGGADVYAAMRMASMA